MHPQPRGGAHSPHEGVAVYIFSFPFLKTKICYAFYTYTPRVVRPRSIAGWYAPLITTSPYQFFVQFLPLLYGTFTLIIGYILDIGLNSFECRV